MKKIIGGEDSLDGTPPEDYLDGKMESMIDSIGRGWRGTGNSGKT